MTLPPSFPEPLRDDFLDASRLERYWLEEVSPEERAEIERWMKTHPKWEARYAALRQGLQAGHDESFSKSDVQQVAARVFDTVGLEIGKSSNDQGVQARDPRFGGTTKHTVRQASWGVSQNIVAYGFALLLAVIGVGIWTLVIRDRPAEQTYATGIGQRITFTLSDGSQVTLAPQTTVRMASTFGANTRTLSVQGEAYFDVVSATGVPFIVKTGDVSTRVLGTRFIVKHYGDDSELRVAVESGKVSVARTGDSPMVVPAGGLATVADSSITVTDSAHISMFTDWVHGQLTFKNTPLRETLSTLSRWYGVQFQITDSSLVSARITGVIPYGSLEDMLQTIRSMLDVELTYERQANGSLLVILGSPSVASHPPLRRSPIAPLPPTFTLER